MATILLKLPVADALIICTSYFLWTGVVTTNPKLAELMIFVLVNMCTHLRMNKYDVLDTVHMVVFNSATEGRLEVNDFVRKNADKDEYVTT